MKIIFLSISIISLLDIKSLFFDSVKHKSVDQGRRNNTEQISSANKWAARIDERLFLSSREQK